MWSGINVAAFPVQNRPPRVSWTMAHIRITQRSTTITRRIAAVSAAGVARRPRTCLKTVAVAVQLLGLLARLALLLDQDMQRARAVRELTCRGI
jgi:hypothetical protein